MLGYLKECKQFFADVVDPNIYSKIDAFGLEADYVSLLVRSIYLDQDWLEPNHGIRYAVTREGSDFECYHFDQNGNLLANYRSNAGRLTWVIQMMRTSID